MAGPYRNNIAQTTANEAGTFSPSLDGIYVIAAPGAAVNITINGTVVSVPAALLGAGTFFNVGGITAISAVASFKYIGLRVRSKQGSSNVTSDVLE